MEQNQPTQGITTTKVVGGLVISRVTAAHQLSAYESQALTSELLAAADAAKGRLAVDMSIVEFMSSSALGVLVTVHKACNKLGGRLVVFGLRDDLVKLIKITHLDRLFTLASDEQAALKALAGR
jgi:anti-sigma B factor antagonist